MRRDYVRIADVRPEDCLPPFNLRLARGVWGDFLPNGARYFGLHLAPLQAARLGNFFITSIVEETSPDFQSVEGKIMVQGERRLVVQKNPVISAFTDCWGFRIYCRLLRWLICFV